MRASLLSAAFAASLLLAGPVFAQGSHGGSHGGHGAGHGTPSADAVKAAFAAANEKMHRDMDISLTGRADIDFAQGMIPHHQGAIDMARIQLEHGTDPEMRKLATEIIAAQETEIAFLKSWLAKNAR
ncbi:MAG: DUF305 domain-containing protein [Alphaproteobacteria bacterium]|nr:DUF305 domain-containing protein [Alphaproteobacteria bacterium]MBU0797449.1 DUF305 domain-containing protein [Alphaproteobacteria bacterium]MBU0888568.1 DUF305 domain-containing protein [Alphaproteobacteria bacterium]MBU1813698.1 DUF305 domain-containing protein [Alphaproteobacteria bacterium]MBU2091271.1 DUF305 domain-containing protein [Alphaproteobacteria bacterium]